MRKLLVYLVLVLTLILFGIARTETPKESGNLNPGEFICNYDQCILTLDYFYAQGGCGTSGIRIKSDRNETSLTCKIVHSCDPGDSCTTS
ncbi:MAG: hypothetical protein ACE5J3_06820, partial [Methanosarcinales archaeon]